LTGRTVPGSGENITLTAAATGEPFATYADPGTEGANTLLESSVAGAKSGAK
jgi:aldehyde dehydrogenase (NAD+)